MATQSRLEAGIEMLGIILGAAILGVIIAVMEGGDFPGWGKMFLCVLAAVIPAAIINALLPSWLFFIGLIVGAACAGVAISAACGMSVKRASIAAGIYLLIQFLISLTFQLVTGR
jgi:hypothetical protein